MHRLTADPGEENLTAARILSSDVVATYDKHATIDNLTLTDEQYTTNRLPTMVDNRSKKIFRRYFTEIDRSQQDRS